jgi:hypothetical protein
MLLRSAAYSSLNLFDSFKKKMPFFVCQHFYVRQVIIRDLSKI